MRLKATSYLKLAGATWWFSKKVPWQKKRLLVNLHTSDLKAAQQKRAEILARLALGNPLAPDFEAEAAEVFLDPPRFVGGDLDGQVATEAIIDRAEDIEWPDGKPRQTSPDEPEPVGPHYGAAQQHYQISTGKLVPIKLFLDAYNRERPVAEGSLKARMSALSRLPFTYLHEYTPLAVGNFVSELARHSDLEISTINQRLLHFKALFAFLQYKGLVHSNPWIGSAIRQSKRFKRHAGSDAWTFEEVKRMLTEIDDSEVRQLMEVLFYGGCRISEACKMRVRDVHFDHWIVAEAKTAAGTGRKIFLPTRTMNSLHMRCSDRAKDSYVMFQDVTSDSEFKRTGTITARVNPILAAMFPEHKVEGRRNRLKTAHGARKTFGSMAEQEGAKPNLIASALGHERPGITMSVYTKPSDAQIKSVFELVAAKLDKEVKG